MEAARRKAESTGYGKIPEIPVKLKEKSCRIREERTIALTGSFA